jgi:hypothetical protein
MRIDHSGKWGAVYAVKTRRRGLLCFHQDVLKRRREVPETDFLV